MSDPVNPLPVEPLTVGMADVLALTQGLMDQLLVGSKDVLASKEVLSIGTGLLAAGMARYLLMHPELIAVGLDQIGKSLELGAETAASSNQSALDLLTQLGPIIAAGVGLAGSAAAATAIPGVPPPP